MKSLNFSTEKQYNYNEKCASAQSVQKGRVTQHAQRHKKFASFLRRNKSYPLWWSFPNPLVLQKTQNQMDSPKLCETPPAQQPLHTSRANPKHYLHNNSWACQDKFNKNTTIQWPISKYYWTEEIPSCYHLATLPSPIATKSSWANHISSRFLSQEDASISQTNYSPHSELRLKRPNCLRQKNRKSKSRLQSAQTWSCFISSPNLSRRTYSRQHSRPTPSRRHDYPESNHKHRVSKKLSLKIAQANLLNPRPWRWWVLQRTIHRILRRQKHWLCNCSTDHQSNQAFTTQPEVSKFQKASGGGRILLSTNDSCPYQVEETTSLCCNSPANIRRTYSATNTFQTWQIYVSGICYQPISKAGEYLAILQLPSHYRKYYQRTKTGFCSKQNTSQKVSSESNLFPFAPFLLQYHQLVQKTLSSQRIPACNFGNHPHRFISTTSKVSKIRQQKHSQDAQWLHLPEFIQTCN